MNIFRTDMFVKLSCFVEFLVLKGNFENELGGPFPSRLIYVRENNVAVQT